MSPSVRIHFSSAFMDRPSEKRQIRTALEGAASPRNDADPDVPTWIVIREKIEGRFTYVAHHTLSQFTLTASNADALCRRIDSEMSEDTRYDKPAFRLDGRPDTRPDHGPGRAPNDH